MLLCIIVSINTGYCLWNFWILLILFSLFWIAYRETNVVVSVQLLEILSSKMLMVFECSTTWVFSYRFMLIVCESFFHILVFVKWCWMTNWYFWNVEHSFLLIWFLNEFWCWYSIKSNQIGGNVRWKYDWHAFNNALLRIIVDMVSRLICV